MPIILFTGMAQVQRDLARSVPRVSKALTAGLRASVEPVKRDAERLSRTQIKRMAASPRNPAPWSVTRVGVTRHEVYLVPKERGVKSRTDRRKRRPNLAVLMLGRSFQPALERNEVVVRQTVEGFLNTAITTLDR